MAMLQLSWLQTVVVALGTVAVANMKRRWLCDNGYDSEDSCGGGCGGH
jgi:hypothetical protein